MKFDSAGIPHIAYYVINATGNLLSTKGVKYAYFKGSGDGDCGDNNDWECDFVDSSITNIGLYPSLDIDYENNVYIAYYDAANDSLKYAYYSGIGICGTGDVWYCQVIDDPDGANVGLFPSLHAPQEASDFLRVAYYDITNGNLKYAYNLTGNCGPSGTWQC
jgi:hypothetical protein